MVWNNNQQTHCASGKMSHLCVCVCQKRLPGFHRNNFEIWAYTCKGDHRKPKQAHCGNVLIKTLKTSISSGDMCMSKSMYN